MHGLAVEGRKLWKIALLVSLAGLMAANCFAAEFGIGFTANYSDQELYFPIKLTNHFRTEISVGFSTAEQKTDSTKIEADIVAAGIGLFLTHNVHERTLLYYGCRLKYLYQNADREYSDGSHRTEQQKGYGIAPTLGFEYFITENISLGGEAEFYYQYLDGEDEDDLDVDETYTGTDGRIVIRYYF